jgi:hypothetical protein
MGANRFDLMTLVFDLLVENFNLGYIFRLIGSRGLIDISHVPCGKTFSWVPKFMTF